MGVRKTNKNISVYIGKKLFGVFVVYVQNSNLLSYKLDTNLRSTGIKEVKTWHWTSFPATARLLVTRYDLSQNWFPLSTVYEVCKHIKDLLTPLSPFTETNITVTLEFWQSAPSRYGFLQTEPYTQHSVQGL